MDADEFYHAADIRDGKELCQAMPGAAKTVCPIIVYYKEPTLRVEGYDTTYVPFIHSLTHNTRTGLGRYGKYVIDPTRKVNTSAEIRVMPFPMHHYSWVRENGIEAKLSNSTARNNIYKPEVIQEYQAATEGTTLRRIYPGRKLIRCKNEFGITWNTEDRNT